MSTQETPNANEAHPITLQEGIDWTTNWRNWCRANGLTGDKQINAFYIPIGDIQALAATANANGARAYLALQIPDDFSSIKIVLCPTVAASGGAAQDLIEPIPTTGLRSGEDELVTIYDVTMPCPRFCSPESPLLDPNP
jgi:hypothetical protein